MAKSSRASLSSSARLCSSGSAGIAKARAENRYLGRRPSARLKNYQAVKLFREGRTLTQIAAALTVGRGSVYRALEAAGMK